jgi:diguanylate cyclase (GGDEF)-like protein
MRPSLSRIIRRLVHPVIRTERELGRFILRTCLLCVGVALAVDVINQLVFFISWPEAIRSWAITVGLALAIAYPVSRAVGRAYLGLSRQRAQLEYLSRTDELTGLLNRRALLAAAAQSKPQTMALVIADIDRFKRINDRHGHLAGDKVIQMVSRLSQAELGDLGHLGRLGGEEFALLGSAIDRGLLALRLERLRVQIALTPVIIEGTALQVTISAGVAFGGGEEQRFDELYAEADRALYAAKAAGRNRICFSGEGPAPADTAEPKRA